MRWANQRGFLVLLVIGNVANAEIGDLVSIVGAPPNAIRGFGVSTAVSGTTAIIGAGHWRHSNEFGDAAYLFDVVTGEFLDSLLVEDVFVPNGFGRSVDIDGNLAIVGTMDRNSGAAYVYDVSTADLLRKLEPPDRQPGAMFGNDVAISGNLAIVGALGDSESTGAAYVFDVTTGEQIHKLTAQFDKSERRSPIPQFGVGVALDGTTAVVSEGNSIVTLPDGRTKVNGSAYLFDVATGEQKFELKRMAARPEHDAFGAGPNSVDIQGDIALIGARTVCEGDPGDLSCQTGASFVFDVTTGEEVLKLVGSDVDRYSNFGQSVSIEDDTAIIGTNSVRNPAVYVFDLSTGEELHRISPDDLPVQDIEQFGYVVAMEQGRAIVGAPASDTVFVFEIGLDMTVSLQAGDANADFRFDQLDLVRVLAAAKYLSGETATFGEGDWNRDGVFDQFDIAAALGSGNYLQGPYAAKGVPEPTSIELFGLFLGLLMVPRRCRVRKPGGLPVVPNS